MRVRLRFAKVGKIRFTSHRDVARLWERALRKADIEAAYTEGFSPRPKLHFGLALSTGHESEAEYLDIDLVDADGSFAALAALADAEPGVSALFEALAHRLNPVLTDGLTITAAGVVETRAPSLQEDVVACRWSIVLAGVERAKADDSVATALAAAELPVSRVRKGERRVDDVRGAIEAVTVLDGEGGPVLDALLATKPRGLRPGELLAAVFGADAGSADGDGPSAADLLARRVVRRQQFIERDGSRSELPPLAQAPAPHTGLVCV